MDFLKNIKTDTILIIPQCIKSKVLKYLDTIDYLINIKIISLDELKKHLYFDYDINTILYLMTKYNYKYDVSIRVIGNLYYVKEQVYNNEKLDKLVNIKKELSANNLLIYDTYFKELLKDKDIIVYGYDYLDKHQKNMINEIDGHIILTDHKSHNLTAYQFNTMEEELSYVLESVIDLVRDGIELNKIKIVNVQDYYYNTLIRLANFYNIPININSKSNLSANSIVKVFIDNLSSIENGLASVKEKNTEVYNSLVNICNKYMGCNYPFDQIKECIMNDLKNTSIGITKYQNALDVIDINNYLVTDEYIFYISFNQKEVLVVNKDEDYLEDNLKQSLELSTSNELNKLSKMSLISKITGIEHLIITYKLNYGGEEYYPSNLIKELNIEVKNKPEKKYSYSKKYDSLSLGTLLDRLIKYGEFDPNLSKYYSSFDIPYMKYDNKYEKINYQPKELLLSYSSINDYYKCAFKYYLKNVLKIEKYEETFSTLVGSLFHQVLSKCFTNNFNFDDEWNTYLKDKELKINEEFFLIKLKKELNLLIASIKEFYQETELTDLLLEKKIIIDKSSSIPVTFMGIVDKIMYKDNNAVIIDYKTGNPDTDLTNMAYGINMQLGIYLYLLTKSELISNLDIAGLYFQKILNNEVNKSYTMTYLDQKRDSLKLIGYTINDTNLIKKFDPTYENSKYIRGMKTSSTGFYAYTKLINENDVSGLISLVDKKIDEARNNIIASNFDINPKRIGDDLVGCNFCEFKDICFRTEKDIINLKKYDDLSFLGGDSNA